MNTWLSARSIACGLPKPTPDRGGLRVDTGSADEIVRWVFAKAGPDLEALARSIDKPRYLLKLCGTANELKAALPSGWGLHAPGYFMRAVDIRSARSLPVRYRLRHDRRGMVIEMRIHHESGALAGSGYAADTPDAFVYDRIVVAPEHRRKGIGSALMGALREVRQYHRHPELLVATEEGQALYTALGWETVSDYSTASLAAE